MSEKSGHLRYRGFWLYMERSQKQWKKRLRAASLIYCADFMKRIFTGGLIADNIIIIMALSAIIFACTLLPFALFKGE